MEQIYVKREALKARGFKIVEPAAVLAQKYWRGTASILADIYRNAEGTLLANIFTYTEDGGNAIGSARPHEGVDRSEDLLIFAECRRDYGYDENGRAYHFKQVMR